MKKRVFWTLFRTGTPHSSTPIIWENNRNAIKTQQKCNKKQLICLSEKLVYNGFKESVKINIDGQNKIIYIISVEALIEKNLINNNIKMDKFQKMKEIYESENPGKRFTIGIYDMLNIYNNIFSKSLRGEVPCVESLDGYMHIKSTQKLLTYFPKLKRSRNANYMQLHKYKNLGFIEIKKVEENNWFKPTELFFKCFR